MKKILLKNSELIILENWIDISSKLGIDPKTCSNAVGFISNQTSKYPLPRFVCCTNKRASELTAEELQQMKKSCKELCPELELDGLCHTDIPVGKYLEMLQEFDATHGICSEYIACTNTGTLHRPRNLSRSLEKLVERAGLTKEISLHTLRHTFGSSLIRAGVGVEVVSRLMGHANIMVTYNKYIHVIREQESKAMTLMTII